MNNSIKLRVQCSKPNFQKVVKYVNAFTLGDLQPTLINYNAQTIDLEFDYSKDNKKWTVETIYKRVILKIAKEYSKLIDVEITYCPSFGFKKIINFDVMDYRDIGQDIEIVNLMEKNQVNYVNTLSHTTDNKNDLKKVNLKTLEEKL